MVINGVVFPRLQVLLHELLLQYLLFELLLCLLLVADRHCIVKPTVFPDLLMQLLYNLGVSVDDVLSYIVHLPPVDLISHFPGFVLRRQTLAKNTQNTSSTAQP